MQGATFEAGDLCRGEAPARQAQRVAAGAPLGLLHVQAHQRARRHRAPCMQRNNEALNTSLW